MRAAQPLDGLRPVEEERRALDEGGLAVAEVPQVADGPLVGAVAAALGHVQRVGQLQGVEAGQGLEDLGGQPLPEDRLRALARLRLRLRLGGRLLLGPALRLLALLVLHHLGLLLALHLAHLLLRQRLRGEGRLRGHGDAQLVHSGRVGRGDRGLPLRQVLRASQGAELEARDHQRAGEQGRAAPPDALLRDGLRDTLRRLRQLARHLVLLHEPAEQQLTRLRRVHQALHSGLALRLWRSLPVPCLRLLLCLTLATRTGRALLRGSAACGLAVFGRASIGGFRRRGRHKLRYLHTEAF
mmetsp:Transcript_8827/g.26072  ORF Transcript_8827/g.26072 Transcript_8827/m.26072 type:complete len:298 (+) Transcript_8827:4192-5085(+)